MWMRMWSNWNPGTLWPEYKIVVRVEKFVGKVFLKSPEHRLLLIFFFLRKKGRRRKKHQCESETSIGCLPHTLQLGIEPQSGHVSRVNQPTFLQEEHSNQPSHTGRECQFSYKVKNSVITAIPSCSPKRNKEAFTNTCT